MNLRLRGRKGIREALEQQQDLVVLDPEPYRGKWNLFFGNERPIYVELGMGKGRFISEMSVRYPEINFIGVDMYDELVRRASEKAQAAWGEKPEGRPRNLALVRYNIQDIEQMFADHEIERIFLNFSDPWPKKRHIRRRLTHSDFLRKYVRLCNEKGEIHLKTDSVILFEFSLNSFSDMGLRLRNISLNLHGEALRDDLVMTEYEMKFVERGQPIYRCEAIVGHQALENHRLALHRF